MVAGGWRMVPLAVVIPVAVMVAMVMAVARCLPVLNGLGRWLPHDDGWARIGVGLLDGIDRVARIRHMRRCRMATRHAGTNQAARSRTDQGTVVATDRLAKGRARRSAQPRTQDGLERVRPADR